LLNTGHELGKTGARAHGRNYGLMSALGGNPTLL
jgi:hypothetical protein